MRSKHAGERLTAAEERSLLIRWRDDGDVDARNRVIAAHRDLAAREAANAAARGFASFDDLFQEATIGLVRAADAFNPALGWRFGTLAIHYVREHIRRFVNKYAAAVSLPASGDTRALVRRITAIRATDPEASADTIAAETGAVAETVADLMRALDAPQSLNVDDGDFEANRAGVELVDPETADGENAHIRRLDLSSASDELRELVAELPENERIIIETLHLRSKPGLKRDLSERLNVCVSTIRKTEQRAISRIRSAMIERRSA